MERKAAIREFVRERLACNGDTQPFSDETSLLLSCRLQSVAVMGFDQERIDTVNVISSLIEESSMLGH
jgi:hypothetical protein